MRLVCCTAREDRLSSM